MALARRLGIPHVQCIPVSALAGDNVVERGTRMEWYAGPTVLEHLETVPIARSRTSEGFRFPVQYVIRPDATFRGFAGQVAGGAIHPRALGTAGVLLPPRRRPTLRPSFFGASVKAILPSLVVWPLVEKQL